MMGELMFSGKLKALGLGVALVSAAMAAPAAASDGVVVKSTGPSSSNYPVGRQVSEGSSITLRAGDRITVLTDDGTTVMQGPGTFRVGEGATRTRARFSNLTRRGAARRARTGAVRSGVTDVAPRSPNLWFVNVAAGGSVCLYDTSAIRLWRPIADEAQTYSIVDQGTQTALDVTFVGTEAVRALDPAVITISSGTEYSILAPAMAGENEERPTVNVRFVTLDQEYETPDALAGALIANGCTAQLAVLADTLEEDAMRRQ